MRASWVIVLVAACGGGGVKDIKDTPPPAPEATCHVAGEKLIELVVAGQTPAPPDDAVNKLISLVEKRCDADKWKPEARACFSKVKSVEEADACTKNLSEAELANLSGDMAPPGGSPESTGEGGGAPPDGAGDGASRTRGMLPTDDKAKEKGKDTKPKGSGQGKTGDPCDGGE
jgi:hypothetical protein